MAMLRHAAVAVVALAASCANAYHVTGNWTQLSPNPYGKHEWHSVVSSGGTIFTMGGNDNSTHQYNVVNNHWSKHPASFPENGPAKIVATDADMIGGTIFLFGGKQSGTMQETDNNVYALSPFYNAEWTNAAPLKNWVQVDASDAATAGEVKFPPARDGHSSTHAEGRLWVFGGWNEKVYLKDMWFMAPHPTQSIIGSGYRFWSGTWHNVGDVTGLHVEWPDERNSHSMVAYGGFLYMFGGFQHNTQNGAAPWVQCKDNKDVEACKYFNDVWRFDTTNLIWHEITPKADANGVTNIPTGRARCASAVEGNGMYIFGGSVMPFEGDGSNGYTTTTGELWRFDLQLDVWNRMDSGAKDQQTLRVGQIHPGPRTQMQMVSIEGSLYVYGGNNGSVANDLWRYTPDHTLAGQSTPIEETHELVGFLVVFIILFLGAAGYICFLKGCCGGGFGGLQRGPSSGSAELGGNGAYNSNYQSQS